MRASFFRLSPILALALLLGALSLFPAAPAEAQSPAAPTNLTVSAGVNNGELYLLWTAPSGTLTGYDVHYTSAPATGAGAVADSATASGADPAGAWVAVFRDPNDPTTATTAAQLISSLTNDTTYRLRVRAKTSSANGAWVFGTGIPGAVWAATLTADENSAFFGCDNFDSSQDDCSTSTVLTEDQFRYGGTTYTVTFIYWQSASNQVTFGIVGSGGLTGQQIKTALSSLTLNVDGTALAISDAIVATTSIAWNYNPDPDWTDGQTVQLSLRTAAQQVRVPSSDATLLSLRATSSTSASGTFSALTLSPSFAPATTAYTATVRNAVTHVKLRPAVNDFKATVEVGLQGQTLTAVTQQSGPIALSVGANAITVKVTAQNGSTTKTYTVTVTRAQPSSDADLSGLAATQAESASGTFSALTLSPSFAPATTAYTASVANPITHLKLRPTAGDSYATVEVGKGSSLATVTSGQPSAAIALSFGANAIAVKVTAEDGSTTKTYTVTVTRAMAQPSGAPPAAATGTEGTLVSNLGQAQQTYVDFDNTVYGQGFTTGPYVDGYTLQSIDAILATDTGITSEDAATVRAEVWSDNNGTPGIRVAYLSARNIPTGTSGNHTVAFVPSYGITVTLAANTTYHFVIYTTGSPADLDVQATRSADEDAGAAEGWSIADQHSEISQNTPPWAPAWTTSTSAFVKIAVKGKPVSITHWTATLAVKDLGRLAGDGCIGQQQCSDQLRPGNSFTHGAWPYNVLAVRVVRGSLQILLDRAPRLHPDQTRLDVGGRQFQFKDASESWGIDRNEDAWRLTWHGTGLSWSDGDTVSVSLVGRNVPAPPTPAPNTDLHPVRVHYDEMRDGEPVDNFNNLRLASPNPSGTPGRRVELRAYIPGTFPSADPEKGIVTTTHVMLRVRAHPDSTLGWAIGNVSGVTGMFAAFPNGGYTPAIALNPDSKWTYIYLRVTNGSQSATHLVAIDPPPRTYTLTPEARVAEGEEAALTLSLGSPAGAGGVSFAVAADYPDGGATAEDVGDIAATVTVPEGQQSVSITIPTVDDEAVEEDEERFTVRVAHAGEPAWAVDTAGTDAAVVTIVDNDEPPEPPAPPEGPEPWDIRVVPGDGTLTVTWNVGSRAGVEASEIWHVLRWSQEPGVWANPRDPRAVGKNDGLSVDPGLTGYTITGLENGVATGVFIRSMVGHRNNMSERYGDSSKWVRVKGEHTTPRAGEQQQATPNTAPTVSAAIADATIVNESGTHEASLAGVFSDGDGDALTITAASSDTAVATVSVAADYSTLTVSAQARGTATVTVTAEDDNGGSVEDSFSVSVKAAPAVASAIADVSGLEAEDSRTISMSGVFSDADGDTVTVTQASSSDTSIAAVSAALAGATAAITAVTVTAGSEGTATVTVTARDSDGNTVQDAFDVTVNAPAAQQQVNNPPTVSGAIADVSGLEVDVTQYVSLSGVFSDADGDSLTITASSSDEGKATVTVASDGSKLTVAAVAEGTATITVTARDADGSAVSDAFEVVVVRKYAALISQMYQWRNDPQWVSEKAHTDRWDRALKAFGETVADQTLTPMTAAEAQGFADRGWARWVEVAKALREIEAGGQQQQAAPNRAPTVSGAVAVATIVSESGTRQVSLSGVFADADGDELTITAGSSDDTRATVSVSADHSTLTVSAKSRGTATITVNASDGRGGTVDDTFTVTVKAAPTVASALADVSGLEAGSTQDVSLSGVFSDADGDSLTVTAASSDEGKATVAVASDGSKLTLAGVSAGTATITVTARDADGNTVQDAFEVVVVRKYAALISQMYQWRNDPQWVSEKAHTDRWDRALKAFGETVADQTLTPMTAAEAQEFADRGWTRWVEVAKALREIEAG